MIARQWWQQKVTQRPATLAACGCFVSLSIFVPTARGAGGFAEFLLQDNFQYAYGLAVGDLNGDGRPDITAADATRGEMSAFVNQGSGSFSRFFIKQGESGWFERHSIGDVNQDGKPDVVVVKNQTGQLVWFGNPGAPIQSLTWTRNVISSDFSHAYDVDLADFNNDGRLDVAASSWMSGRFAWFENPGPGGTAWTSHLLDEGLAETRTVRAADFNGDGRPDVLGTSRTDNKVVWYENPGQPFSQTWSKRSVDTVSNFPTHGQPSDIDGDGRMDIVMAFGFESASPEEGHVAWYENLDGNGITWQKHLVGSLPNAFETVAGDLTGDGNLDLVATAWGSNGQLVWFENPGDPTATWIKHVVKDNWSRANSVVLADFDLDGRLDIVAAAEQGSNEVRWWRNELPAPEVGPHWNVNSSGDWNVASNWSGASVPNAVGAKARLFSAISSSKTIYTDTAVTLGTLRFNNANTYVIAGSGTLTLDGGGAAALVEVQAGTHKINLPLTIASDTTLDVATGATLKISDPVVIASGKALTPAGAGSVVYESTITLEPSSSITLASASHVPALTLQGVSSAVVATHTGVSPTLLQVDSLSIDPGSKLDLKNNALLVSASPSAVRAMIKDGSIDSTSATLTQDLGYLDAGSGKTSVMYTLLGDLNLDQQVDSLDFSELVAGYGMLSGAHWRDGDVNYDDKVTTVDFNALAGNFGVPFAGVPSLGSVVPEPGALLLCFMALGWLPYARRRPKSRPAR